MSLLKSVFAVLAGGLSFLLMQTLISTTIIQTYFPYNMLTLGGMRQPTDPIMVLFFLHSFILMMGSVILYPMLKLAGTTLQKGMRLGALMWLAYSVPSSYVIYTSMTYPVGFYLESFVFSFASWVIAGIIIARTLEEKTVKSETKKNKSKRRK